MNPSGRTKLITAFNLLIRVAPVGLIIFNPSMSGIFGALLALFAMELVRANRGAGPCILPIFWIPFALGIAAPAGPAFCAALAILAAAEYYYNKCTVDIVYFALALGMVAFSRPTVESGLNITNLLTIFTPLSLLIINGFFTIFEQWRAWHDEGEMQKKGIEPRATGIAARYADQELKHFWLVGAAALWCVVTSAILVYFSPSDFWLLHHYALRADWSFALWAIPWFAAGIVSLGLEILWFL